MPLSTNVDGETILREMFLKIWVLLFAYLCRFSIKAHIASNFFFKCNDHLWTELTTKHSKKLYILTQFKLIWMVWTWLLSSSKFFDGKPKEKIFDVQGPLNRNKLLDFGLRSIDNIAIAIPHQDLRHTESKIHEFFQHRSRSVSYGLL